MSIAGMVYVVVYVKSTAPDRLLGIAGVTATEAVADKFAETIPEPGVSVRVIQAPFADKPGDGEIRRAIHAFHTAAYDCGWKEGATRRGEDVEEIAQMRERVRVAQLRLEELLGEDSV